jgi:large subunit ribosomal protein L1
MGKVRVKTLGDEAVEEQEKMEAKKRSEAKKAEKMADAPVTETASSEEKVTPVKKAPQAIAKKIRSPKYLARVEKVEKSKAYKLAEAVELLPNLALGSFDETVELHINTNSTGISGTLTLPHGTGKQTRVAIATDALITEIEGGTINFDVLVAEPAMMPKLAKVAKILGPRGLMPNPKNGTVSPKPEDVAKKFEGGQTNYKTEAKFPILHLSVGKISFGSEKLSANIKNALQTVQKANIKNVTLKTTMSPAVKLDIASI